MGKGTGNRALDLLADILGAEIIAAGPVDSPLPVTGRCGSSTIRYGPAGSPLCDQCRDGGASPCSAASPGSCARRARIAKDGRSRPAGVPILLDARSRLEASQPLAIEPPREVQLRLTPTPDQFAAILRHSAEEG